MQEIVLAKLGLGVRGDINLFIVKEKKFSDLTCGNFLGT